MQARLLSVSMLFVAMAAGPVVQAAQSNQASNVTAARPGTAAPAGVTPPPDYVIGADDVLSIVFWRDKEMSGDVVVRSDGNISLPLVNDVRAAGLTPEQLRTELVKAAAKYIADPNATIVVKEIRSRNVFVTGNVAKPGKYPLVAPMNVMQLIAVVGGLQEYADRDRIVIMRTVNGKQQQLKFNYDQVLDGKRLEQNIVLQPGDTLVVP